MTPNRIVAGAVALLGLLTLAAGLLADLGTAPQVAALAAGAIVLLTPTVVWLRGWQAWEARQGEADQPVGWDDLREQLERLAGVAAPAPAAAQELGYVATTLVEALRDSVPVAAAQVVRDPGTEASGYVPALEDVAALEPLPEELVGEADEDVPEEELGRP